MIIMVYKHLNENITVKNNYQNLMHKENNYIINIIYKQYIIKK